MMSKIYYLFYVKNNAIKNPINIVYRDLELY